MSKEPFAESKVKRGKLFKKSSFPANTANMISVCRIFLSLLLLLFTENIPVFLIIYVICGASDILDGFIARKLGIQSALGAKIDSLADMVMFGVIVTVVVRYAHDSINILLPWVILIAAIRVAGLIYARLKFRRFAALHTLGNKAAGFLIFLMFPIFVLTGRTECFIPVFIAGIASAVEEIVIHIVSESPDLNIRGIWELLKK